MKRFSSSFYKLKSSLWRDETVCVAPASDCWDNYFPLSKPTRIKMPKEALSQAALVSIEVFKRVNLTSARFKKQKSLHTRQVQTCLLLSTYAIRSRCFCCTLSETLLGMEQTVLAISCPLSEKNTINDDAFGLRDEEIAFWKLMHEGFKQKATKVLLCSCSVSHLIQRDWEWQHSSKAFTDN